MERRIVTGGAIEEKAGKGTQCERFHQDHKVDHHHHHQAGLVLARQLENITWIKTRIVLRGM